MSDTTATTEDRMAKLIYSAIMSLDGYIEDADGTFGWAEPHESHRSWADAPVFQQHLADVAEGGSPC
jgi:hypothetical protein